jgi:SAM-dependent methyltransferase
VGIDISPFFSAEARRDIDLLIGDLRKLPFADGTFTKACSLDVLEHLSPEALRGMLAEAARVLAPGGALFVYTHVRKNARIAIGLRWINAFAEQLQRWGLTDLRQEHLRKSDHLNPLRDIPELEQVAHAAGFRIGRIRYYTPIVGGFVENILMRMAERAMARHAARRLGPARDQAEADAQAIRAARTSAKRRIASSPVTYAALRALSVAMKLDLLLFGRIRSGPFFALLVKE